MAQTATTDIVTQLRDGIGRLVIVDWCTRIGLPMRSRFHCFGVETFTQDDATWVRATDDYGMAKVTAPVSDVTTVRVLRA